MTFTAFLVFALLILAGVIVAFQAHILVGLLVLAWFGVIFVLAGRTNVAPFVEKTQDSCVNPQYDIRYR